MVHNIFYNIQNLSHNSASQKNSPTPLPSTHTRVHTCFFFKSHDHMCQREKASFFLVDGPVKSTLFGGLVDIFAKNTVISPRRAKHASVCLLIPHKRTAHSFVLAHKQRQTFPLLCRLFLFLLILFSPFLSEPRKGALIHSPRNKPGGPQTTHRAVQGSLPDSLSFSPAFPLSFTSLVPTFLNNHSFAIIPSSS